MRGELLLPWEEGAPLAAQHVRKLGYMREGILGMLKRDPSERMPLAQVDASWRAFLGQDDTCDTTACT